MATAFRTGSPHPGRSAPSWRYADSRSGWIAFVKLLKLSHYTISSGLGPLRAAASSRMYRSSRRRRWFSMPERATRNDPQERARPSAQAGAEAPPVGDYSPELHYRERVSQHVLGGDDPMHVFFSDSNLW